MNRESLLAQFDRLLPLAAHWAQALEARILREGVSLSEEELADATALGVRQPQRVRLLCLASVPTPADLTLRAAASAVQFLTPATRGLALRYGVFVRADCWRERGLIAHELAHTEQYERLGGIELSCANIFGNASPSAIPPRRWSRRRSPPPVSSTRGVLPNESASRAALLVAEGGSIDSMPPGMRLFVPRETQPGETRVALVPEAIQRLAALGAEIWIEAGLGASISISDQAYQEAGAQIASDRQHALHSSDLVLRVRKPPENEVSILKPGCIHISLLDAFNERDLVRALAVARVTAIGLEMLPRITIAQKMDVLSSQASLAGYAAVIAAAAAIDRIFPMMMTPAGTLKPLRVFVIGVGVAGLQAIATAKRLGARVEAFDTRPAVEEQVRSLGAKFVKVDLGQTGQTAQGYAQELTAEQLEKQRQVMAQHCARADIVITTAQVFGRKAPLIVTSAMIDQMQPGSVVVDMAVESGGNVESSQPGEVVERNGVRILGLQNLAGRVARHASEMYSNNLASLLEHFWEKETKTFRLNLDDEILKHCVLTHDGEIVNEAIAKLHRA